MISQLIQSIRAQQQGREWPLQALPIGPGTVDWSDSIPAHRSEGFTGLPTELPFTVSVDEYASNPGRGYVIRITAEIDGETVELTDQDGPLIWTQQSFRVEMRPKQFTGQWSGWGWRAEVIGREGPDMGVRSLAFYSDPEHQNFLYTIGGAFTEQASEYHPGLTVWAAETPEGQRTAERQAIHWAALYASIQEVKGTIGLDDDLSVGRYFIGLEGAQELPAPGGDWIDSGATTNGPSGANTMGVSDDSPFSAGQTIRVDQNDDLITQVTGIHSANLLLISPHIEVGSGQMIEIQS